LLVGADSGIDFGD